MQTALFYNTNQSSPSQMAIENSKAKSLEDVVYALYCQEPTKAFSWSDILLKFDQKPNENSVKRCITNLMNKGLLFKTTMLKKSIHGKSCHLYIKSF